MTNFSNFAVEISLSSPMLKSDDSQITLDALLASAIFKRTQSVEAAHNDVPLERTGRLWHGSSLFIAGNHSHYSATFIASLNPIRGDMPSYVPFKGRFMRVGGPNKPDMDTYRGTDTNRVILFGRGDINKTKELLGELDGIGKKTNQGYGQIHSIEVKPIDADRSMFLPDGTPARPIPTPTFLTAEGTNTGYEDMATFEPPYFDRSNATRCMLPIHSALSDDHLTHINSGAQPHVLQETIISSEADISGRDFFYNHAGKALFNAFGMPGDTSKAGPRCNVCSSTNDLSLAGSGYTTLCPKCMPFAGRYEGVKRPHRMGAGWMGIITPEHTHLVTSVEYPDGAKPFHSHKNLTIQCGKEHLGKFLHDTILTPPKSPFLLFVSGNSSVKVTRNLAVSWSAERLRISGNDPVVINAATVSDALTVWRNSGLKPLTFYKAIDFRGQLNGLTNIGPAQERAQSNLDALLEKESGLSEMLKSMPFSGTAEYTYFKRLANWEMNHA